jgi:RHS repeat-associated protein
VESNTSEGNQNTQFIAPRTFAYFDNLGRSILSTTRLYQSAAADPTLLSRWTSSYTRYDVLGRVKTKSEPFISKDPLAAQSTHRAGDPQIAGAIAETRTNYDALGRSASVELPNESYNGITVSSAEFNRMQTKSFNPRSNAMTMDKNGLAEASKATDANSFQVNYRYEANGNMDEVARTAVLNFGSANAQTVAITTRLSYDVLGRKISMTDPDKGTLTYSYNALGELLTQVDAKGQTQSLFYDALGRMIERREDRKLATGSLIAEPTAKWIYDNANLVGTFQKAVGLLITENNGLSGAGQFSRSYSYDAFGRSITLVSNLDGAVYYQRTTYDQYGRVFQSFDASTNPSSPAGQLQMYSVDGYPIGVREAANGLDGQFYSEVLALTARQQVRRERYHQSNNLVSDRSFEDNTGRLAAITTGSFGSLQNWTFRWDKNGSLSERHDLTNSADFKEEFIYDSLDRLTTVKQVRTNGVASPDSVSLSLAYDQVGNITSKTGVGNANLGSYQYKTVQAGCATVAGPHAASLVNGKSYCYDVNGNNTEVRKNGAVIRTIAYTGFDLAESIVRDEMTNEGRIQAQVSFLYGTDRGMFKRLDGAATSGGDQFMKTGFEDNEPPTPVGGSGSKVTYYVGNVEFIREGITSSTKRYVGGYLVITNVGSNPAVFDYLLRDSLGSIDTIASETGVLKSRQSFNAHGQRRQVAQSGITASWSVLSLFQASLFNTSTTTQGYTGHEQLDAVGLVHMNARLYDPELGRFIQADDFVEPEATQGLNRYSYVLNNPMSATDPSGNFSLRQALGVVVGIVAAYFSAGLFAANSLWSSFFVAAGGGFASAAIATGSLKAGLWGALSAAAFWGIGTAFSKTVTELIPRSPGVEIVTRRVASGSAIAKVAAHAVAGGTLTQLQGGKFGHGFIAAGFTQALSPAVGQIGDGKSFGSVLSRTAASAAISGTASKLSGGSFANGAQTGAFQELFNASVHRLSAGRNQNEAGSFSTTEPAEFTLLAKRHPQLRDKMSQMMELSKDQGWFDMAQEMGFIAYEGRLTGNLYIVDLPAAEWVWGSQTYGSIPIEKADDNWLLKPVVIYHTHPFPYSFGGTRLPFQGTVPRGPSYADQAFASRYPSAFSVVQTLSETMFFGPRVKGGGR